MASTSEMLILRMLEVLERMEKTYLEEALVSPPTEALAAVPDAHHHLDAVPDAHHHDIVAKPLVDDPNTQIHLSIDSTDEVDPDLNLVKVCGGCPLREKMNKAAGISFVVIVDRYKPVPIEVVPFTAEHTLALVGKVFDELPGPGNYVDSSSGTFTRKAPWPPPSSAFSQELRCFQTVVPCTQLHLDAVLETWVRDTDLDEILSPSTSQVEVASVCEEDGEHDLHDISLKDLRARCKAKNRKASKFTSDGPDMEHQTQSWNIENEQCQDDIGVADKTTDLEVANEHHGSPANIISRFSGPVFQKHPVIDNDASVIKLSLLHPAIVSCKVHNWPEVMSASPPILIVDGDESVCHGFVNLLCFASGSDERSCKLPKPPWLICVEIVGLWFEQTQLLVGFLLEASPWVNNQSTPVIMSELFPWLGCELVEDPTQQQSDVQCMLFLTEGCQLDVMSALPDSQMHASVQLHFSVSYWCYRINSSCGFYWPNYWSSELYNKHWKLCESKMLKLWDPENSCWLVVSFTGMGDGYAVMWDFYWHWTALLEVDAQSLICNFSISEFRNMSTSVSTCSTTSSVLGTRKHFCVCMLFVDAMILWHVPRKCSEKQTWPPPIWLQYKRKGVVHRPQPWPSFYCHKIEKYKVLCHPQWLFYVLVEYIGDRGSDRQKSKCSKGLVFMLVPRLVHEEQMVLLSVRTILQGVIGQFWVSYVALQEVDKHWNVRNQRIAMEWVCKCIQFSSLVRSHVGPFLLSYPWSNALALYDADHQELQLCLNHVLQLCAHVHISSIILIQQEWFQLRHSSVSTLAARTMHICTDQQVIWDLGDEMVNQALKNKQQKYGVTVEVLSYLKMYKLNQYKRSSISADATLHMETMVIKFYLFAPVDENTNGEQSWQNTGELQIPWDPGIQILHRLEGKSDFKKGGMLGTTAMAHGAGRPKPKAQVNRYPGGEKERQPGDGGIDQ